MAIVESGVGVLCQVRDKARVAVGRDGVQARFSAGWFSSQSPNNVGSGLRMFIFPRLWTSPTDPTDPGLEYGKDWILGYKWAAESAALPVFGAPASIELAGRIALPITAALANEVFDSAWDLPIPGLLLDLSAQSVVAPGSNPWLGLQLAIQSEALQTAVAVVQLGRVATWSGN